MSIKVSEQAKTVYGKPFYVKLMSYERLMKTQRSPCETAVWSILPTIRCEVSKELAKLGLSQMMISARLGVTQPAVSQYVTSKRGTAVAVSDDVRTLIQSLAEDVAAGKELNLNERICAICTHIQGDEKCTAFNR